LFAAATFFKSFSHRGVVSFTIPFPSLLPTVSSSQARRLLNVVWAIEDYVAAAEEVQAHIEEEEAARQVLVAVQVVVAVAGVGFDFLTSLIVAILWKTDYSVPCHSPVCVFSYSWK
jgi:hypothetical protein